MKLHFKEIRSESEHVKTIVFIAPEPLAWQAGQYIHYTLPHDNPDDRGIERWFTISSAPFENEIHITTRIAEKSSSFKKALLGLTAGQEIEADAPEGDFIFDQSAQSHIFVAGGIGITPYHAILSQLNHDHAPIHVELLYANRSEQDVPFREELEKISNENKDFHITYFNDGTKIDEIVLKHFSETFDKPVYYISGPEPMTEAFEVMLKNMEVSEDRTKLDFFPGYETTEYAQS